MGQKVACNVNKELLPFKLHFFFAFGAFGGVLPFMPLVAKQLGINAMAVGVGYSMIPIFIFLWNPVAGLLVDYFQDIKVFLILLIITGTTSYLSVLSIPSIKTELEDIAYVRVSRFNQNESLINLPSPFKRTCLKELLESDMNCQLMTGNKSLLCDTENTSSNLTSASLSAVYNETLSDNPHTLSNAKHWITFYIEDRSSLDINCPINSSAAFQCIPTISQCLIDEENSSSVFSTYQFWTFIILSIIGGITFISAATLSSAACYEVLGTHIEVYGRQRLFGTISWGLMCPLAGILNDIPQSSQKSFSPGFYLMTAMIFVDVIILCVINIPKANYSTNMCADLGKILSSKEILIFSFGVILIGSMNSLITTFEFWYLEDMGADQKLLGLSVTMQCLVGELPFLFFSGWFVKKLGHFLCLVCVFAGFAVRLFLYSIIQNPWLVLPIDTLHGVTFGIYHGAMTSFAKVKAPTGLEATLLGMFGGLYDGLGCGLGSFLGGIGLNNIGPRKTFLSASMINIGSLLVFLVATYFFRSSSSRGKVRVTSVATQDL